MAFKRPRWTFANILPLLFVSWIVLTIWAVYVYLHLKPLLDISWPRFQVEAAVSQVLTLLLVVSFVRASATDPGSVPDTEEWRETLGRRAAALPKQTEVKNTGGRRLCKWCCQYKPDRCHHCRVCNSCILRMDHHCPWLVNCVGYKNHKYFLLTVFYSLLTSLFMIATLLESVSRTLVEYTDATERFLLVFATTLGVIMAMVLGVFFSLHIFMVLTATTTIEFCEKRLRQKTHRGYQLGLYKDLAAILGPQPLLWLLPCAPPDGDGLHFATSPDDQDEASSSKAPASTPLIQAASGNPSLERNGKSDKDKDHEVVTSDGTCAEKVRNDMRDAVPPEVTTLNAATV